MCTCAVCITESFDWGKDTRLLCHRFPMVQNTDLWQYFKSTQRYYGTDISCSRYTGHRSTMAQIHNATLPPGTRPDLNLPWLNIPAQCTIPSYTTVILILLNLQLGPSQYICGPSHPWKYWFSFNNFERMQDISSGRFGLLCFFTTDYQPKPFLTIQDNLYF